METLTDYSDIGSIHHIIKCNNEFDFGSIETLTNSLL